MKFQIDVYIQYRISYDSTLDFMDVYTRNKITPIGEYDRNGTSPPACARHASRLAVGNNHGEAEQTMIGDFSHRRCVSGRQPQLSIPVLRRGGKKLRDVGVRQNAIALEYFIRR